MPASVFLHSTERHNQDKVSMGTIAARDCLRVLELVEQVAADMLIAVAQAVSLRVQLRPGTGLPEPLMHMLDILSCTVAPLQEDRRLDGELRLLLECMHGPGRARYLPA